MALSDLFRPKWKHSNPKVRREAIEIIDDQSVLAEMVLHDEKLDVQKAALKKITHQSVLKSLVLDSSNIILQKAAIEKVKSKKFLSTLANTDKNSDVCEAAKKRQRAIAGAAEKKQKARAEAAKKRQKARAEAAEKEQKAEQAKLKSSEKISVLGVTVPMITDQKLFSRIVQRKDIPIGLLVRMDDFTNTYGRLLTSVPNHEMLGINPLEVNHERGPCRLFCFGCRLLLPGSFSFRLPGGAGEAFGAKPVRECPKCGSKKAVILSNPTVESERCGICSGSQSPACAFPYSEEEEARFTHIGTFFYKGVTPEDAIQQLVKEKGWNDQSTRNCVNLTYARIGQIEDESGR